MKKRQIKKKVNNIGIPGIEKFKLSRLKAAKYNPRTISKEALEGLTNSISRFGCVEPVVVNTRGGANVIIGGHQRIKALKKLGVKECICVTVDCSESEEKVLNLTLNNPSIQGRFIEDIGGYIDELRGQMSGTDYLDLRIAELRGEIEGEKKGLCPDDDIPAVPKKAITKTGDLWILGQHRLLCGDCTKQANVGRLMGKQKADMVFTDPPYGINVVKKCRMRQPGGKQKGFLGGKGIVEPRLYRKVIGDDKPFEPSFLLKMAPKILLFGANNYASRLPDSAGWLVWNKGVSHKTSFSDCELIWTNIGKHIRCYDYRWSGMIRTGNKKDELKDRVHPTQKPVGLLFQILNNFKDEKVLDPFLGSGSTMIACEKLGRRCFGMEIDPLYVDVAVKRWEMWTGKKARRVKRK